MRYSCCTTSQVTQTSDSNLCDSPAPGWGLDVKCITGRLITTSTCKIGREAFIASFLVIAAVKDCDTAVSHIRIHRQSICKHTSICMRRLFSMCCMHLFADEGFTYEVP